jgi:pyruvate/2-oxoglutarate dehydrogenase complex dihydrolipoamide acyltransferase (E2) component
MHARNLLIAAFAITIGLAVGVTAQSNFVDGVKVNLPYAVNVGDTVLEPGEYEIRRASQNQDQVLRIFSNDKMRYETNVITVPALEEDTPEETKVVLHHIGDDYYFDKIWIEGKDYGYEFVLPERARALKRELAETIPATYMPGAGQPAESAARQTTPPAAAQSTQSTQPAQPSESAPSTRSESAAAIASTPSNQSEIDRQAQAERDRQAETAAKAEADRQAAAVAQVERERQLEAITQAEQDRQAQRQTDVDARAALQNETQTPAQQPSTGGQTSAAQQRQDEDTAQLPATASNWLGWVLGGALLVTLSAVIRSRVSE